jgi:hypothetical protein
MILSTTTTMTNSKNVTYNPTSSLTLKLKAFTMTLKLKAFTMTLKLKAFTMKN